MRYSKSKEIDKLVKDLVRRGWLFHWGEKHGRIGPPGYGGKFTVPKTPSDRNAHHQFRRDIRKFYPHIAS